MAYWIVRAGKHGGEEDFALEKGVVVIGWGDRVGDLTKFPDKNALLERLTTTYTDRKESTLRVWAGEIWAFRERIAQGDLVALPLKTRSAVALGRISGAYQFDPSAPDAARHQRPVKWLRNDLPRSDIDPDILASMGATLTVFQVTRNNAEQRIASLLAGKKPPPAPIDDSPIDDSTDIDLEEYAKDQISTLIGQKFREHNFARLVAGVLEAQGYKVLVSPPGADGGVDIVAGSGVMGFDSPRIAVQVKSSDTPADVAVLRELQGVMPGFGASHGLVVSWGGFKESVRKEARRLFFHIKLWDAGDLVSAILENYAKLPADFRAELPLKQIWTVVSED